MKTCGPCQLHQSRDYPADARVYGAAISAMIRLRSNPSCSRHRRRRGIAGYCGDDLQRRQLFRRLCRNILRLFVVSPDRQHTLHAGVGSLPFRDLLHTFCSQLLGQRQRGACTIDRSPKSACSELPLYGLDSPVEFNQLLGLLFNNLLCGCASVSLDFVEFNPSNIRMF